MEKNWKNIEGKMRIFKNKSEDGREYFTTTLSTKKEDGTYDNMSVPVSFTKSIDTSNLPDNIDISDGFLTFYKKADGTKCLKVMIMKIVEEQAEYIKLDDLENVDELPF